MTQGFLLEKVQPDPRESGDSAFSEIFSFYLFAKDHQLQEGGICSFLLVSPIKFPGLFTGPYPVGRRFQATVAGSKNYPGGLSAI